MVGIAPESEHKITSGGRRQEHLEEMAAVVSRVAHDYGNVLTGILGFTELALGQLPRGSAAHQYVTEIHRAALQGSQLTDELRMFSRRGSVPSDATELAALMSQEEARLQPMWGLSARLKVKVPADLPAVAMSPEPLRQVLGRLLDNAREALTEPGQVVVSARATKLSEQDCLNLLGSPSSGAYVEIMVSDNGRGLTPDVRQHVLKEPFFSTKPRHRGLGLAVVYGLLQTHRGGFELESGDEGGTIARVFLPVAQRTTINACMYQPSETACLAHAR